MIVPPVAVVSAPITGIQEKRTRIWKSECRGESSISGHNCSNRLNALAADAVEPSSRRLRDWCRSVMYTLLPRVYLIASAAARPAAKAIALESSKVVLKNDVLV